MAQRRIRLHLLHTPRVVGEDGREHLLAARDAALLALVALEGPITRSRAAAMVWPGADEHRPLNNLRQRLFRLRRLVGADVVLQGPMLQLSPAVDHDLAGRDRALQHDPDAARGDVLGGLVFDDDSELASWVEGTRQRWRAARADALLGMATRLEAEDRLAEALRYAARVTADDPVCEHGARVLMRLHYRRGDRGAALAEYDRCVTSLHQWLGEAPSAETNRLAEDIGRAAARFASPPVPPPAGVFASVPASLAGADGPTQRLACVAALSGDAFSATLAAAVLGCAPAWLVGPWRTLEALGVLRGARFEHEGTRQAVVDSVPAALKPGIHRDIARALKAQRVAPLQRVPHWEAAAAWPEAAADLGEAATEAWRAGQPAQASELLRRAAHCHRQAGRRDAAFRCEWRAAQVARRPRPAAEALAADAGKLASAEARGDLAAAAHLAGQCARHHARLGDMHAGIASARRAVALARRAAVGSGCTLAAELGLAGHLGDVGHFDEALPLIGAVITRSLLDGFVTLAVSAENERAVMLSRLGRADLAARLLRDLPPDAPRWTVALRRLVRARIDPGYARRQPALLAQAHRELVEGAALVDPYGRRKLALEAARLQDATHACAQAARVRTWADAHGHVALARQAAMVEVEALGALGRHGAAADAAEALLARFGGHWQAYGYWLPELWCTCHQALAGAGRRAAGAALLAEATAWLERCAAEHVPPLFRPSFLERNPFHAKLRHLARAAHDGVEVAAVSAA